MMTNPVATARACSALDGDKCRNGFPVKEACHGKGPWAYASETPNIYSPRPIVGPVCCDEETCARLYPETGRPNI